ncbi:MAG: acyltransferase family protein [Actinomycetota bacterium]
MADPSATTSRGMAHHPGLDGVRASALIMIMLFHANPKWIPGGFISVSLFFTLSGYLITSLLVFEGEANGRISLRDFWSRRLRRLAPAALVALLVVVGLSTWLSTGVEQGRVRGDALAAATYVANWRSISSGHSYAEIFADASPLQHLWSLSIEEQLYILVPLMVAIGFAVGLRRRGIGFVFVGASALSVLASVLANGHDRIYYGTDTRAVELFAGAALACFLGPRLEQWAKGSFRWPLALLVLPLVLFVWFSRIVDFQSAWLYTGLLGSFALLNIVFCIGAVVPGPMRWIMSLPPLTLMGRMSYGIYLAHWPVYVWVNEDLVGIAGWPLLGVRVLVTFAIAGVMYRLVEQPIRSRRILHSNRRALGALLVVFASVIALPLVVLAHPGTRVVTDARVLTTVPASTSGSTPSAGPESSNVLVIGDSSAENVALALANASDGWLGVISGGVLGCPLPKVGLVYRRIDENQTTAYCPGNIDLVARHADEIDFLLIVASVANQWDYQPLGSSERVVVGSSRYTAELDRFVGSLHDVLDQRGVPILVLESPRVGDEPMMNGDTAEPRAAWNRVMKAWDDASASVAVVPYDDLLADPDTDKGRAQRPDGTHLEEKFGENLARESLIPRLREVYKSTIDAMIAAGCLDANGQPLDATSCRISR